MLKARTGINPNILCRIGFCLSLEDSNLPPIPSMHNKVSREINRFTLLGKYDQAFVTLLNTRLVKDGLLISEIDKMFLAHINRGVEMLAARIKSIADLGQLECTDFFV
jgi:DNA sulfur modification protein DndE